jgi:hypothetical protein
MSSKTMPKHDLDAGNPDNWESAELQVARPTSVMLSARIPADLVVQIEAYAANRSMTVSDIIRLAMERILLGIAPAPTYALLATTEGSSLKLAGPTVMVHAVSSGSRPEWVIAPQGGRSVTGTPAA